MKAQLTLEYLVLLLVFLVLLSVSLTSLYSMQKSSKESIKIIKFTSEVDEISKIIKEVCALGSGNQRLVEISHSFEVFYFEEGIRFSFENNSISKSFSCEIEGASFFTSSISILNTGGKINLGD